MLSIENTQSFVCFGLGDTPSCAQGLFLVLCPDIIFGGAQGTICGAIDRTWFSYKQHVSHHCTIDLCGPSHFLGAFFAFAVWFIIYFCLSRVAGAGEG